MKVHILSLFPDYFRGPFDESMIKRAREAGLLQLDLVNIRDYAVGKHRRVDDRPYGGGPGMVLMADPVAKAIRDVKQSKSHVVLLSPKGQALSAEKGRELASREHLILLCGHYEGFDQRVIDSEVDEQVSIGDYVLTNGCLSAIVLLDVLLRFIPGVLGHEKGAEQDSFEDGLLDCPHYTRPVCWEGKSVPEVLLGGHHGDIERWRRQQSLELMRYSRPDLFARYMAGKEEASTKEASSDCREMEIQLFVRVLKKSLDFYKKGLGLSVCTKEPYSARVQVGSSFLRLVEGSKEESVQESLPLTLQLKVEKAEELRILAARLTRMGIAIESNHSEGQFSELICQDPDGVSWVVRLVEKSD